MLAMKAGSGASSASSAIHQASWVSMAIIESSVTMAAQAERLRDHADGARGRLALRLLSES